MQKIRMKYRDYKQHYADCETLGDYDKSKMKMTLQMLFNDIRNYGTFTADFECVDSKGVDVRVRTADYDGKKYFIVQMGGEVVTVKEI